MSTDSTKLPPIQPEIPTEHSKKSDKLGTFLLTSFFSVFLYAIPQAIAGALVVTIVLALQAIFAFSTDWLELTVGQFVFIAIFEVITLLLLLTIMKFLRETWRSIGVKKPQLKSVLGYSLVGFGAYFILYLIVAVVAFELLPIDTDQEQEIGFDRNVQGIDLLLIFLALVVLVPFVEEVIFRGFLYTRFRQAFSIVVSSVFVSILFGLAHLQLGTGNPPLWTAAIDTFVLSVVLVWLREKTGNIWSGVGVHAIKNGIAFYALFISRSL